METRQNPEAPETGLSAAGVVDAPLAKAAALDSTTFAGLNPNEAIPATWEERAAEGRSSLLISSSLVEVGLLKL